MSDLRWTAAAGLLGLLSHTGSAFALGFGEIRVHSALNQPLDATLNLVSLSDAERGSLSVGVAGPEMFERFGIERSSIDDELRIDTTKGGGSSEVEIRLTTRKPVREPFLRFLIEANTSEGKALREYTVLLDPPGQPAPAAVPPPAPANSRTIARSPSPERPAPTAPSIQSAGQNSYGPVGRGDTLYKVAQRTRRPGTTQDQMQVAIFRDNPDAFGTSMSVLMRGATLNIPPAESVAAIDPSEAHATIREQTRIAQSQALPERTATVDHKPMLTKAETPAAPAFRATLRLEAPRAGLGGSGAFGRLVEPDSGMFSPPPALTSDADTLTTATQPSATGDTSSPMPIDGQGPAAAADQTVAGAVATPVATSNPAAVATAASNPPAGLSPVAATSDEPSDTLGADADGGSRPISDATRDVVGVSQDGWLRPLNLLLILALAGLLALLLIWNRRRQYKPVALDFDSTEKNDEHPPQVAPSAAVPDEPQESAPLPAADAPAMPAAVAGVAASVRVQDADRQMKLGLFDDARSTLEAGLAQAPEEAGLQDKLLERDYLAGDADAFKANVTRFEEQLAGNGVRWAGVAAMGRILLPGDSRFVPPGSATRPIRSDAGRAEQSAKLPEVEPRTSSVIDESDHSTSENEDWTADASAEPPATGNTVDRASDEIEFETPRVAPARDKQIDARSSTEDDRGLSLDTDAGAVSEYEWQPQRVPAASARQHDRSDEPGMAFELDTSDFPASSGRPDVAPKKSAPSPIDASEFNLGEEDCSGDSTSTGDTEADAVDIRLDLARMYLEMEDNAAARELLEEAEIEGSENQRRIARELLDTLEPASK